MATIDDLLSLGLRIATIESAEAVLGSEKLLSLQVSFGEEVRQIVSGIAKAYDPASLPGKQVIIVSNLAPRTIFGIESNGMVLAASTEGGPVLLSPIKAVAPGTPVA